MSNILQGIVYLTPEQYETLVNDGHITANGKTIAYNKNTLYITKAANSDGITSNVDLSGYYTKEEVDNLIASIEPSEPVDLTNYYTKEETNNLITGIETFDGDYNSLTNKPEIPENISELNNDVNYITANNYATNASPGTVQVGAGLAVTNAGIVRTYPATSIEIFAKSDSYRPITPSVLDYAVKVGITSNAETLTADERIAAQTWLDVPSKSDVSAAVDAIKVTKVSELTNDSLYITNQVNDLVNYYTKTNTYTKTEVDTKIADLIDSAPETRNTLKELSDAIKENEDVIDTLNSAIGNKANQSALDTTNSNIQELSTTVQNNKTAVDTFNSIYNKDSEHLTVGYIDTGYVEADDFYIRIPNTDSVHSVETLVEEKVVEGIPVISYSRDVINYKISGEGLSTSDNILEVPIETRAISEEAVGNTNVGLVLDSNGNNVVLNIVAGVNYDISYTYGDTNGVVTYQALDMGGIAGIMDVQIPGLQVDGVDVTFMIVSDASPMGLDIKGSVWVTDPTGIEMSAYPDKHLTITSIASAADSNDFGPMVKDVDNLVNYYKKSEIDSKIPTAISQLTNDAGFITDYTEADPTVPSHVKAITEANITSWNNKVESSTLDNYSLTTHNHDLIYSKLNHGHAYNELTGKPTFATVATSGSYNDLLNKPTLFSGSYNDLTDKPTIPNTSNFITKDVNNLTNYTTTSALNTLLSAKAASSHTHSYNDLSDLPGTLNITSTQISLVEVD